jgi:hypothetical protein
LLDEVILITAVISWHLQSFVTNQGGKRFGSKAHRTSEADCRETTIIDQATNLPNAELQQFGCLGHG